MPDAMQMLSVEQTLIQQSGGTWSDLFSRTAFVNAHELTTVLVWFGAFWLLGLLFLPLSTMVFRFLNDKGYGVSRLFGLLITAYCIWLGGFFGIEYSRQNLAILIAGFLLVNALIFFARREEFIADLKSAYKTILISELVFLSCFVFFLLVRFGNPDLWHPYKGGERPMDFSYFNAILKSSIFPPYDPWFAGGYLNYYYYGIFLSGVMVKLLGIIPSVAFNLILPLWYAFLGSAAFSLGSTLYGVAHRDDDPAVCSKKALRAGLFSVIGMQILGNLGTIKQIRDELVELGAAVPVEQMNGFIDHFSAFFVGIGKRLAGEPFHMYRGDWYWIPSRAIPDSSITEFPFFTFLYGDPHAHLFALPVTVLVLIWLTVLIIRCTQAHRTSLITDFLYLVVGAFLIGTLIPTNTWDMPTYLLITVVVLVVLGSQNGFFGTRDSTVLKKCLTTLMAILLVIGLTFLLFTPYLQTNSRENAIEPWNEHTPVWSYLMHWGLFLFIIVSWYVIETWFWLSETPLSSWKRFMQKTKFLLRFCLIMTLVLLVLLQMEGITIGWIVIPLMIWSLVLLFRPRFKAIQRFVIFLVGTSLFATLLVELIHLVGDYGRMNMVFKFYNQVWVMLSLCAAFAMASIIDWLEFLPEFRLRTPWIVCCRVLVCACFLYTIVATTDKVNDRMSMTAPHTLDGMKYMESSSYWQDGFMMDLSQDYYAIQWMQENVQGSPVIVEANATEYKFGTRYTMYTGLPGVVGWNYHQRQQRGPMSGEVWRRVDSIEDFYNTTDVDETQAFLDEFDVQYIVVGQLERGLYDAAGIAKFGDWEGSLWDCVYDVKDTQIFMVNQD